MSTAAVRVTSAGHKVTIVQSAAPVPATEGGGGDSGGTFVFNQTNAQSTWMIYHNLGRYPAVTVLDQDSSVVHADVRYLSTSIVSIGFAVPVTGKALLT